MSEDYKPKVGDRVRVTVEGKVAAAETGYEHIGTFFRGDRSPLVFNLRCPDVVSVERLEPEWQVGDVVRGAGGNVYLLCADGRWRTDVRGCSEQPPYGATLLVRNGKPVTP